jgi:glutamate-1-semialdehyde aminotransferase
MTPGSLKNNAKRFEAGVYLPPSAFEAAFTSAVHGEAELAAFEAALTSAWRR